MDVKSLINQRRRQILVHSALYYRFDVSIVDDKTFDRWAYELVELQKQHPEIAEQCVYHAKFKDFDGTTGFHLTDNAWAMGKAQWLYDYYSQRRETDAT